MCSSPSTSFYRTFHAGWQLGRGWGEACPIPAGGTCAWVVLKNTVEAHLVSAAAAVYAVAGAGAAAFLPPFLAAFFALGFLAFGAFFAFFTALGLAALGLAALAGIVDCGRPAGGTRKQ